jgi:uncharacterized protein Veg
MAKLMIGAIGSAALLTMVSTAGAQDAPVRIRGSIEAVDGQVVSIKARDGSAQKVTLTDNATIAAVVNAKLSDIKQGSYVGATAMPETDGSWRAVEVHIFLESMRGAGEGHRPWDLQPKSTMTNATVDQMVSAVDGQTLTLKYKDGDKKILVPKEAPIVSYEPGSKSDLKPGAKIFIGGATKKPDGSLETNRINVGKNGVTPPM